MRVDRIPLSDEFRRQIAENIEIGRAARRRRTQKFPFRNRWLIVNARERSTWRQVWDDLIYLVKG